MKKHTIIDSQVPEGSFQERFAKVQFGKSARIRFYRQMERLLTNGKPPHEAFSIIWNRASDDGRKPDNPQAIAMAQMSRIYKNGRPIGVAIAGWVPHAEQMLIEAGDQGSNVPKALRDCVEHMKNAGRMKGAMIGGMTYPVILAFAVIGVLYMFGTKVIPPFAQLKDPKTWTGGAAQMKFLSDMVRVWTIPLVLCILSCCVAHLMSVGRWTGNLRKRLDRFPPWSMYRMFSGAQFLLSFAALYKVGEPAHEALPRLMRNANPWLHERLKAALTLVNSGNNIGDALHKSGFNFPDKEIIADMRVYANLTGFEDILETMAKEWVNEGVERIEAQAKTFNMIMLFIMAGTIAWLGWGLFELQSQVTSQIKA